MEGLLRKREFGRGASDAKDHVLRNSSVRQAGQSLCARQERRPSKEKLLQMKTDSSSPTPRSLSRPHTPGDSPTVSSLRGIYPLLVESRLKQSLEEPCLPAKSAGGTCSSSPTSPTNRIFTTWLSEDATRPVAAKIDGGDCLACLASDRSTSTGGEGSPCHSEDMLECGRSHSDTDRRGNDTSSSPQSKLMSGLVAKFSAERQPRTRMPEEQSLLQKRAHRLNQLTPLTMYEDRKDKVAKKLFSSYKRITWVPEGKKIYDLYCWDTVLQETGDGGKVVVCRSKEQDASGSDEWPFVLKMRKKDSFKNQNIAQFRKTQERLLNFPPHVGVLPVHEVLEDDNYFYVVMDKANCDLFSSLVEEFNDGVMPGHVIKSIMREILEAVGHVHKNGMLHRDIKPDNLVAKMVEDNASPTGTSRKVQLIDFDHAEPEWSPKTPSRAVDTFYGTMSFNAPETFLGSFSQMSDLYSVGVIFYLLMAGKMPYDDEAFCEERLKHDGPMKKGRNSWRYIIYDRLAALDVDWTCSAWTEQTLACEFCQALLAFDPKGRPSSAEEALRHPWLSE